MADWRNATTDAGPERGVVHRDATRSVFDLGRTAVPPRLEPFVETMWWVRWDLGDESFESAVIPYPCVNLTLEWGDSGARHGHAIPSVLVHGVVTSLFTIGLTGSGGVVGARFRPGGFAALFGVDVSTVTDRVVRAEEMVPTTLAHDLLELLEVADPENRAHACAELLARIAPEPSDRLVRMGELVDQMRDDETLVRVDQLPEQCGWSTRTIQRVFLHDLGAGPKWVLARFRLQEAALALEADPDVDLAALAVELGWFDQAHFTNEFRRIMGVTPGEYFAAVRT